MSHPHHSILELQKELALLKEQQLALKGRADAMQQELEEQTGALRRTEINEARFRAIFESATDGIVLVDVENGRMHLPNPHICRMVGYSAEELQHMAPEQIHPEEMTARLHTLLEELKQHGRHVVENFPVKRKDGSIFYVDITASLIHLEDRPYVVGIFHDITGRREAQEEVNRRQRQLSSIFHAVPVGITYIQNRVFVRVNPILCDCLGYSQEELIGQETSILYETEDSYRRWGEILYAEIHRTGEVTREITFLHKDGHAIDFLLRGVYLDPHDPDKGSLFALTDITDRRRAEREVEESRRALTTLLGNLRGMAYRCENTPNWPMSIVSRGCLEMTGYSAEEFMERRITWNDLVFPDDQQYVWDTVQEGVRRQEPFTMEYRIRDRSGEEKWVWEKGCGIVDEQGQTIALEGFITDISDRKEAEQARERLLKELRVKNEELESIVFIASHDLRSPLVNIEGFAGELKKSCLEIQSLLDRISCPPDVHQRLEHLLGSDIPESIQFISAGAGKMDSLLSGLLRLSRIGTATIHIEPIRMNALLQAVLGAMRYQVRELGVRVDLGDLPDCLGDAVQVNQVFSNLIDNAIKYRHPDRPVQIRISGTVEGDKAVYAVADNGIGINPNHFDKIFEIFHQLNPGGTRRGEGLGLTIIRRILNRLDGRIWVRSQPEVGSTFFVSLPKGR